MELKLVRSGDAKFALLPTGYQIVQKSRALDQALKILQQLSQDELRRLEERQAKLALLRKGDKVVSALDPAKVAARVAKLKPQDEIVRLLEADSRLNAANLKKVATELNIGIPSTVRSKAGPAAAYRP